MSKQKTPAYVFNSLERHGSPDESFCRRCYYITKTPGYDVAYLPITASVPASEQRRRAALYTAAPELLAACEMAAADLEMAEWANDKDAAELLRELIDTHWPRLRAVATKARAEIGYEIAEAKGGAR